MSKLRVILYVLGFFVFAATANSAARASSFTYDFTYSGGSLVGSTASGSGSFTYDSVTSNLTAFAFSDVIHNSIFGTDTFTYGLGDLLNASLLLASNGQLMGADITTNWIAGQHGNLGKADFTFNYLTGLAVDATTGTRFGDGTAGSGTFTLASTNPSAAPEPSSLMLLGTGILGIAGMARRKFRRVSDKALRRRGRLSKWAVLPALVGNPTSAGLTGYQSFPKSLLSW